ncbi:MAG: TIGR02594 family protein [Devosiaceae bacterium]|nr:TIGR02594 family protein [Devosiaceae bacterium MH13]
MHQPIWLRAARQHVGTAEWAGERHNPTILRYFQLSGHAWVKTDETPWCAAFVNAVLEGLDLSGTGTLTARSFLKWGLPLDNVRPGAVAVFRRG